MTKSNPAEPHYQDESVTVYHGDCLDVLAQLPDASVDSVVTDPPYGLEFMGKDWDAPWKDTDALATARMSGVVHDPASVGGFQDGNGGNPFSRSRIRYGREGTDMGDFQNWCELWARECLRVLKPGGHLLAFGGTRTWHRLACAVEDAGFEIRDNIAWLYGSGFPKSLDVSKAIDKAAGAEREVMQTIPDRWAGKGNVLQRSQQAEAETVNITAPATDDAKRWQGWGTALKPAFEPVVVARKPLSGTVAGNVLAHGVGALNIDGCRVPATDGYTENAVTQGVNTAKSSYAPAQTRQTFEPSTAGRWPSNVVVDEVAAAEIDRQSGDTTRWFQKPRDGNGHSINGTIFNQLSGDGIGYDDSGGASRYFPIFRYHAKAASGERPTANGIAHPTVKPLDLMRWLVRLVTPPGGTVLEPFAGSGTTAEACIHEHLKCIAIEREADYLPLIVARLTKPMEIGFNFEVGA